MEKQLNAYLCKTISIRDTAVQTAKKENFYHATKYHWILLGLLSYREDWELVFNVESSDGYSDILVDLEKEGVGIVIEEKVREKWGL